LRRYRDEYLKHLADVPMFRACSKKDLALIARLAENHRFEKGQDVVKEGKRGQEFYVIVDGKAKVTRGGRKVATLGAGDHFGELALLDPSPRDATVTAETPLEVLILMEREFRSLLMEVPMLERKLLVALARRLHALEARPVR
jgi:CRP-like cAMP-binding protein